ncbi:YdeI family protein [Plantactinospora solaniradicis]|uniref:YdeI family protein n=1 Tax=Plantactinospora solaniradicis TaxID=1723736 RepID=A0ABW1KH99_9ACTN
MNTSLANTTVNTFVANSAADWRGWLARNCRSEKEVWLIIHHRDSVTPSVRYHEAIEHALCYGWIDSQARKHDADSCRLRFTPRNPRSTWSRVNRERAAKMTELGLMTEHGQALIDLARANGTWQVLSDAEGSAMPDDLRELLDRNEAARTNFENFPPSSKRLILEWVATAKRAETRRRRIAQTVDLAAVNLRANHPGIRVRAAGEPGVAAT